MKMFKDNKIVNDITSDNGSKEKLGIYKDFGRGRSDLIFILPESVATKDIIPSTKIDENVVEDLQLPIDIIGRVYYGYFFISANKNKCFRITNKETAKYALIDCIDEGYEIPNNLYEKRTDKESNNSQYFVIKFK